MIWNYGNFGEAAVSALALNPAGILCGGFDSQLASAGALGITGLKLISDFWSSSHQEHQSSRKRMVSETQPSLPTEGS
ncbi:hypothetical protein PoB_002715300, partial [Plakobranchus ocellatus]